MKHWIVSTLLFAVLIASFSNTLAAKGESSKGGPRVLKVATDATWPPMEYIDENKEIVGFEIDMLKAAAKAGGFEVDIRNAAWDGIFAGLASGSYDLVVSSVTITEERKKAMDFSMPYINAGQVIIVQKSTNGVSTLDDLVGSSVGAQIGTTGAIAIDEAEGVELKSYDELGLAVADLANGKIRAVVADTPIAADYALNNDTYKNSLKIVGDPFTEEYYGIAVQKGNREVLDLVNKGLQAIKDSGELDQLIDSWLK